MKREMRHVVSLTRRLARGKILLGGDSCGRSTNLFHCQRLRQQTCVQHLEGTRGLGIIARTSCKTSECLRRCGEQSRAFSVTGTIHQQPPPASKPVINDAATPSSAASSVERPGLKWQDYDPEGGLPLPGGDVSDATVRTIFSDDVDAETGNWILRLMNWRRQSGSLIDQGVTFAPGSGISKHEAGNALSYLREVDPTFDENQAGIAWAESEIQEISSSYVRRAEKLGLYKKTDEKEQDTSPEEADSVAAEDLYGESQLVKMRREAEARFKQEEQLRLEQQKAEEERELEEAKRLASTESRQTAKDDPQSTSSSTSVARHRPSLKVTPRRTDRADWVKRYEEHAELSKSETAPELSTARRLLPSLLATIAVLAVCYIIHQNYVPAPTSARMFPDTSPTIATLTALTGGLFLVAVAYRLPPLWRTFNKYFVQVPGQPTASSVLLATFTHQQFSHLFSNLLVLWPAAYFLHEDVGRGDFLAIFLAAGTIGNLASLTSLVLRRAWAAYGFGSSAAVYGVLGAACVMRADRTVEVGGVKVPMVGALVLAGWSLVSLLFVLRTPFAARTVQAEGHIGGLVAGALCAWALRRDGAVSKQGGAPLNAQVGNGGVDDQAHGSTLAGTVSTKS